MLQDASGVVTSDEQAKALFRSLKQQAYTVNEGARQWIIRGIEWQYRKERILTLSDFYPTREQLQRLNASNLVIMTREEYVKAIRDAREEARTLAEREQGSDPEAKAYARDWLEHSTYSHRLREICRANKVHLKPSHVVELEYIKEAMTEEGIPIPPPVTYKEIIENHRFKLPQAPPVDEAERRERINQACALLWPNLNQR